MTDIVIVGAGFAGFWAVAAARRTAPLASIALVSRRPDLELRPRLYEAAPQRMTVDLRRALATLGATFVPAEVTGIDVHDRTISGDGRSIGFKRLIVASGSIIDDTRLPGGETLHTIDTVKDAVATDIALAELAASKPDPSIAVIGGGFTGIELVLELRDRLSGHGGRLVADRARIVLVDRAPAVGEALGPGPRPAIEAALAAARVDLKLDARVATVTTTSITFDDGGSLAADLIILCTGMRAAPLTAMVPGRRDDIGRVVVDQDLRAKGAPTVFVAGDAASVDDGTGHIALQSCQHALQQGRFAGENAARDLTGLPTIPYAQPGYVTCLDLGRAGAVTTRGWKRDVVSTGDIAKAMKQKINRNLIVPPVDGDVDMLLKLSRLDRASQVRA